MENMEIIRVTQKDVELLQEIAKRTFFDTFSAVNTEENMKKYLEESFSREKLLAELADTNSEFYFARHTNQVIGYLKLNVGQAQTELKEEDALEIERIYVLKEYQGKNAGQMLYEKALQIARKINAAYMWLGVWENNHRARQFYMKNGFVVFDKHVFKLGNERQTDLLMKLSLKDQ